MDFNNIKKEPKEVLERELKKSFTRMKLLERNNANEVELQKEQDLYKQIEKALKGEPELQESTEPIVEQSTNQSIRELIINAYLKGNTDAEALATLGNTTTAYVYKVLSTFKNDVKKETQPSYVVSILKGFGGVLPIPLTPKSELKKQVLQLVREGKTKADIAEQLGVSRDFVYDVCKTYNDETEELVGYKVKLEVIDGKLVLIFKNLIITIDLGISGIVESNYIYEVISIVTPEGNYVLPLAKILAKKLKDATHFYPNLYSAFPERFKGKRVPNKVGEIESLTKLKIDNITENLIGFL